VEGEEETVRANGCRQKFASEGLRRFYIVDYRDLTEIEEKTGLKDWRNHEKLPVNSVEIAESQRKMRCRARLSASDACCSRMPFPMSIGIGRDESGLCVVREADDPN